VGARLGWALQGHRLYVGTKGVGAAAFVWTCGWFMPCTVLACAPALTSISIVKPAPTPPPAPCSINISEGMSRRLKCMAPSCGVVCDEDKVGWAGWVGWVVGGWCAPGRLAGRIGVCKCSMRCWHDRRY